MEEEEEEGDPLTRVKMYGRTLIVTGAHMTSYVSALGRRVKENELRLLLGVQARQMKGKKDVLLPFRGGKAGGPCGHKECQPSTLSSRSSGLSEEEMM